MGFLRSLFSDKGKTHDLNQTQDRYAAGRTEQIAVPLGSPFDLSLFVAAARAKYGRRKTAVMAAAALEVAKLIDNSFDTRQVRCMVPASEFEAYDGEEAFPLHFVFSEGSVPKVAVAIVTHDGYKTPRVLAAKAVCERSGVAYLRVYADGTYADWITSRRCAAEHVEWCKSLIVKRIKDNMQQ